MSSITNVTYTSSTGSSNYAKASAKLSQYLSSAKSDSSELISVIKKIYKEVRTDASIRGLNLDTSSISSTLTTSSNSDTNTTSTSTSTSSTSSSSSSSTSSTSDEGSTSSPDLLTKYVEKFVKYYNKIIDDNANYQDKGLKDLTKEITRNAKKNSSSLSSLGISVQGSGKLTVDQDKLETASSSGELSKFIYNSKEDNGLFYNIKKIAANLESDSTYYLSNNAKQISRNANNNISNSVSQNADNTLDIYA